MQNVLQRHFQLQCYAAMFALSVQVKNDPSSEKLTKLFFLLAAFALFFHQVLHLFTSLWCFTKTCAGFLQIRKEAL